MFWVSNNKPLLWFAAPIKMLKDRLYILNCIEFYEIRQTSLKRAKTRVFKVSVKL